MTTFPKISVVVPVYNSDKYLDQCVKSILAQTYPNLDILLINDGSTDGSAKICEELRQSDERIRVIHKLKNQGIGAARNTALEAINTDYFSFVDSDDWIDPNHISDLYELMMRTDSDVAISNFTQFIDDEAYFRVHIGDSDYYEKIYTPEEWLTYQYGKPNNLSLCFTVPWGKLYKTALFENILYSTEGYGEDDATTWKAYLMAEKIAYMHRSTMVYRVNSDSMTQQEEETTIFSPKPVAERLEVLSLLGLDVSLEVAAYEWRASISRQESLKAGDMKTYKDLNFRLKLMEKYRKKS